MYWRILEWQWQLYRWAIRNQLYMVWWCEWRWTHSKRQPLRWVTVNSSLEKNYYNNPRILRHNWMCVERWRAAMAGCDRESLNNHTWLKPWWTLFSVYRCVHAFRFALQRAKLIRVAPRGRRVCVILKPPQSTPLSFSSVENYSIFGYLSFGKSDFNVYI